MGVKKGLPATGPAPEPPPELSYRAVALPNGALLPIEERLGRRLIRTLAPTSDEGRQLLEDGRVEIVAPERRLAEGLDEGALHDTEH